VHDAKFDFHEEAAIVPAEAPRVWAVPTRQVGSSGRQPSSSLARGLLAPRWLVMVRTACWPAASRASQAGIRWGGGPPSASALRQANAER
jgi:hypothetical protein